MISFGNYSKFCQTRSQVIQLKTLSLSRGGFSHLWVRWETIVVKPTPTESHRKPRETPASADPSQAQEAGEG